MTKAKKKRIARRGSEAPPLNGLNRTKTRVILGFGVIVAVALVTVIVRDSLPTKLTDSERSLLQLYQLIRIPLTKDDLQGAKTAASGLLGQFSDDRNFFGAARLLQESDSLEVARNAFKVMSDAAVRLVKGHKEYRIAGCAMNLCPAACAPCHMDKFGDWIQTDATVTNPFMGKTSPHCGVIKQ